MPSGNLAISICQYASPDVRIISKLKIRGQVNRNGNITDYQERTRDDEVIFIDSRPGVKKLLKKPSAEPAKRQPLRFAV